MGKMCPSSDPLPGQTGCSFHSSTFIFFSSIFSPFSSVRLQGCCFFLLLFLSRSTPRSACSSCCVSFYFLELDLDRCSPTPFLRFCDDSLQSLPLITPHLPPPSSSSSFIPTCVNLKGIQPAASLLCGLQGLESCWVALKSKSASNCRWTVNYVSSFVEMRNAPRNTSKMSKMGKK